MLETRVRTKAHGGAVALAVSLLVGAEITLSEMGARSVNVINGLTLASSCIVRCQTRYTVTTIKAVSKKGV